MTAEELAANAAADQAGYPEAEYPSYGSPLRAVYVRAFRQGAHWQLDRLQKLREAFDALLIAEVNAYGGIPQYHGRAGAEQMKLRDVIAEVLEDLTRVEPLKTSPSPSAGSTAATDQG